MARVLDLGIVFTDCSTTGKMRDGCLIALFGMEHPLALFREGCSSEVMHLLPWALMTSLQSDVIARCCLRSSLTFFRIVSEAVRSCPNKENYFESEIHE
jgi:hypothetical protein